MMRFRATVERLGPVPIDPLVAWLSAVPFADWPQQTPLDDGLLRPAMVNDPAWHGFYTMTDTVMKLCQAYVPRRTKPGQRLLSVVMPGHSIPTHIDKVSASWWGRVHVPLLTDPASLFIVGQEAHHLEPGFAYAVNVLAEHSVENHGATPRVHFMADWEW